MAILVAIAGCASPSVGPPVEADLAGTDAESAELIGRLLAEAREQPRDADRRAALGMAYDVSGRVQAARASYAQAVALAPDEPRHRYFHAHARARMGDVAGALEDLESVLAANDRYVSGHVQRGRWLLELDRVDQASEAFERALQLEPDHPGGWLGRARVHLKRGEGQAAARILQQLLEGRQHPYLFQLLGQAHRQAGELDRARAALARATPGAQPPSWPDPWLAERDGYRRGPAAVVRRAEALLAGGRFEEAAAVLEQPLREDPTNEALLRGMSLAFHGLGKNLRQTGRFEEALSAINRAIEVGVARPDLLLDAGVLEANLGHWEHAANRFEQAITLDPSLVAAHVGLGGSKAELGDFEAAERALARATSLEPDNPAIEAARRRLAELQADRP